MVPIVHNKDSNYIEEKIRREYEGVICLRVRAFFCFLLTALFLLLPKLEVHASHTLNYFNMSSVEEDGEEIFRIEVGMSGKNLDYETVVKPYLKSRLVVKMKDTEPGKLDRNISSKNPMVSKIKVQEVGDRLTQVAVELNEDLTEDRYRVYTKERDKKAKKPYRVIIDIKKPKPKKEEAAMPGIKGRAIVIDPGHGGSDSGAVGPSGARECDVTLAVSKKLQEILTANGARVRMTRETDKDVYGWKSTAGQELRARVNIGNFAPETDIFVSVHCNAFTNPASHGMETYYYASSAKGRKLATVINEELAEAGGLYNRGVKTANFFVIKHSKMPATLLELAFITNPKEEALLTDEDYQNKLAAAIAKGIERYFTE